MKKYCIDCGKKINGTKSSKRCRKCYFNSRKTEKHKNINHCIKCNKEIERDHKVCIECYLSYYKKPDRFCLTCGTKLNKYSKIGTGKCPKCYKVIQFSKKQTNRITPLKFLYKSTHGRSVWLFKCHCGIKFKNQASLVLNGTTKSCGCLTELRLKRFGDLMKKYAKRGKDHPRWIKDRTKVCSHIRNHSLINRNKYRTWSWFSTLYKRKHNLTCELTGYRAIKTKELSTHHIVAINRNPVLCFEESNLICIKTDIHNHFHKLYGKKVTEKEWNDFVSKFYPSKSVPQQLQSNIIPFVKPEIQTPELALPISNKL